MSRHLPNVFSRALCLSMLVFLPTIVACGEPETVDSASDQGALAGSVTSKTVTARQTAAFAGKFEFVAEGHHVSMTYSISHIDWSAKKASFASTIVDAGGFDVTPDNGFPLTIEDDSNDGFIFAGRLRGDLVIALTFERGQLKAMSYSGFDTTSRTVAETSESTTPTRAGRGERCATDRDCADGLRCRSGFASYQCR